MVLEELGAQRQRVLREDDRVLSEPASVIAVGELGSSSVDFVVRPWVRREDYWAARWDLTRKLKHELEAAGCSIPFPQRDVHHYYEGTGEPLPEKELRPSSSGEPAKKT